MRTKMSYLYDDLIKVKEKLSKFRQLASCKEAMDSIDKTIEDVKADIADIEEEREAVKPIHSFTLDELLTEVKRKFAEAMRGPIA